jgi:hypothetical protein
LDEIQKIRSKSETYNSLTKTVAEAQSEKDRRYNQGKLDETPWVMWFDDMASKSAIKKHAKVLPISSGDALAVAAELDNKADMGAVDLRTFTDPDAARAVVEGEMDVPEAGYGDDAPALEAPQAPEVDMNQMTSRRTQVTVPASYAVQQEPQQRQQHAEPPAFDPDAFADRMQAIADKNDLESLDLMADELRSVKDADAQETLRTMYQRLRAEVEDRQASGQASLIAPPPATSKRGKNT